MRISIGGKIVMALLFASLIGGISAGPALARDGDRGYERPEQRGWHGERGRPVYRPRGYYYPAPRYGPPIYTVPAPSPGVRIFLPFPFDIR